MMIYHRGSTCLSTFDMHSYYSQNVKKFWIVSEEDDTDKADNGYWNFPCIPVMAVADHKCNKIIGISFDKEGKGNVPNLQYMGFYAPEEGDQGGMTHAPQTDFQKSITKWTCLEISLHADYIFVGGEHSGNAKIGAVTFDENMNEVRFALVDPTKNKAKCVTCIRRFLGRDLLMVGCDGVIFITLFANKNFQPQKTIEIAGCGKIENILVRWNKLIILDDIGAVFVKRCAKRIDNNKAMQIGIP